MNIWKILFLGGSALALVQILAVLVCWRFTAMRGRAVVEPFAEEPPELGCGCPRDGRPIYGCMSCGSERCPAHRNAGCCDRNTPSVWDALDRHLHDQPADVLVDDDQPFGGEHEADVDLSEENEAYAVDFVAWGTQCADLEVLAEQLDGAR